MQKHMYNMQVAGSCWQLRLRKRSASDEVGDNGSRSEVKRGKDKPWDPWGHKLSHYSHRVDPTLPNVQRILTTLSNHCYVYNSNPPFPPHSPTPTPSTLSFNLT